MEKLAEDRKDALSTFHNKVVACIDETVLNPAEVSAVLRIILSNIDKWFEIDARAKKEE